MTDRQSPGIGVSIDRKPHAFLHDILVGTVVINNPARAQALRMGGPSV